MREIKWLSIFISILFGMGILLLFLVVNNSIRRDQPSPAIIETYGNGSNKYIDNQVDIAVEKTGKEGVRQLIGDFYMDPLGISEGLSAEQEGESSLHEPVPKPNEDTESEAETQGIDSGEVEGSEDNNTHFDSDEELPAFESHADENEYTESSEDESSPEVSESIKNSFDESKADWEVVESDTETEEVETERTNSDELRSEEVVQLEIPGNQSFDTDIIGQEGGKDNPEKNEESGLFVSLLGKVGIGSLLFTLVSLLIILVILLLAIRFVNKRIRRNHKKHKKHSDNKRSHHGGPRHWGRGPYWRKKG